MMLVPHPTPLILLFRNCIILDFQSRVLDTEFVMYGGSSITRMNALGTDEV